MTATTILLLSLGTLLPSTDPGPPDLARLREMLHDRQAPLQQSQAALLLVSSRDPQAAAAVREGLRQGDAPEVFLALATALRVAHDHRFHDELFAALVAGRPNVRQAAAETLALLMTNEVIQRLQALADDTKAELAVRQAALWALGRSGRKQAALVLIDQLASDREGIRQAAAESLTDLTGEAYGPDGKLWQQWWQRNRDLSEEQWLEARLAYQAARSRRLEGDLERARTQVRLLHQQLYNRLPVADRLGYVQSLADQEDAAVRALAVPWCVDLYPGAGAGGQKALADVLLRLSQDSSPEIQRAAVLALGPIPDPCAFDRLRGLLRRAPAPVRAAAARGLALQARGTGPEAQARQREVVPALQKALDDPAIEVVVEVAEGLGGLGVPEAGPVLTALLKHPSEPVRHTAAQALERVADATVLDSLLEALDDQAVSVRFSLIGAVAQAAGDGRALAAGQRERLFARLETALARDADPGVRSRAATVLGDCVGPAALPGLWKRLLAPEDPRVQEKAWAAMVEVIARSSSAALLHEWDRTLAEAKQVGRRQQLLAELHARWQKKEETRPLADLALESLAPLLLEQGKWAQAFPLVRELLGRPADEAALDRRLRWLLTVAEQALGEDNRTEALRAVQEAQGPLTRRPQLAGEFEKLEKQARQ